MKRKLIYGKIDEMDSQKEALLAQHLEAIAALLYEETKPELLRESGENRKHD